MYCILDSARGAAAAAAEAWDGARAAQRRRTQAQRWVRGGPEAPAAAGGRAVRHRRRVGHCTTLARAPPAGVVWSGMRLAALLQGLTPACLGAYFLRILYFKCSIT